MNSSHKIAIKSGAAPLVLAIALCASPSFAQTAPAANAPAAAPETPGETIIVTGSRIARPELKTAIPIAVVNALGLQNKGQTNLLDALKDLPISGQSADRSASNFSNFDNGVATVNLRNLGKSRTLVLINGRRSVGIPGDSAVDLNNIPTDLIDRVEIATGGTSAVYGSDAVAGVVNILLKNHFEGVQLHMQGMTSGRGDAGERYASLLTGTKFAGGKGHVVLNLAFTDDDALKASQRTYSQNDTPQNSSYAAQGLFDTSGDANFSSAAGQTYTFDRSNNVKLYEGAKVDGYRRASQRLLATPLRRYTAAFLADYEFGPEADLYTELTYNKTKANSHIEALAVDDSGAPGQSVLNLDGSPFPGISVTNPYLPAQIANAAIANGVQFINFRRRSVELFDRSPVDNRDFWRGVIGLKGQFGAGWRYDVSYEHSQVRDDTRSGAILLNNYGAALDATTINGQIVCADPAARAAGCVPINIFGYNTASAAAIKWLSTYSGVGGIAPGATAGQTVTDEYLRKSYQDVATVNISGALFRLPAGPVGVSIGGEYHHEKAREIYDPFTNAGISSAQQATNTIGSYNSKEAYGEVSIPLLADKPFFHALTLEGAARYANYSTVGSVWSYKYGGTWAPHQDILFRAMYARAVRAPNINELFANKSLTAIQVIDPCDQNAGNGDTPPASGAIPLPAACKSIPGIANYLANHPGQNFAYSLAQVQTAYGYLGGNLNLNAEATNTFTAGMTVKPSFFRGFDMTVDYYNVKVKNAISSVDQQTSVDQCFQTSNPQFCNSITRDANGFIKQVDSLNINAASYQVAGIDLQARYALNTHVFAPNEHLTFALFYNHKFKQQQTPFVGGPVSKELGTADQYAGSQLGTGFKNQFTLNAGYNTGPVSFAYKLKYLGPVTGSSGKFAIPSYTYSDIQVKFTVGEAKKLEFYVGSNNVFDKQPPLITSGNSQWPGTNTVADTYDLFGRMLYAGVTAKF
ncbi:TonB-dependent receptor [Novosphingobium sp.]|uniref:TonB-dependent receptor plug domain-containing protein n=1 Tax=Novosphingobium sp. TaxID=1874826 RepID=UPI0033419758